MKTLLALALAFLTSCGSLPFVGYANLDGSGSVRWDGGVLVAVGRLDGEVGVFGKTTDLGLASPLDVELGTMRLINKSLDLDFTQPIEADLPEWAEQLFRPGEWETLRKRLMQEAELIEEIQAELAAEAEAATPSE